MLERVSRTHWGALTERDLPSAHFQKKIQDMPGCYTICNGEDELGLQVFSPLTLAAIAASLLECAWLSLSMRDLLQDCKHESYTPLRHIKHLTP